MDQKSLYDDQFKIGIEHNIMAPFNKRDIYLINEIKKIQKSNIDLFTNILELSIGDASLSIGILKEFNRIMLTCADISQNRLNYLDNQVKNINSISNTL